MGRFNESLSTLNRYGTVEERTFAIDVYVSVRNQGLSLEEACERHGKSLAYYTELRDRMIMRMDAPKMYPRAALALVLLVGLTGGFVHGLP